MTAALDSPPQVAVFDLGRYLARLDADALVRSPDYRRAVSRVDPLAFAWSPCRITYAVMRLVAGSHSPSSTWI